MKLGLGCPRWVLKVEAFQLDKLQSRLGRCLWDHAFSLILSSNEELTLCRHSIKKACGLSRWGAPAFATSSRDHGRGGSGLGGFDRLFAWPHRSLLEATWPPLSFSFLVSLVSPVEDNETMGLADWLTTCRDTRPRLARLAW
jgi:hypothetical protein